MDLPKPIALALDRLIRRARRLIAFRGLCASCAVGIAALLGVMAIDAGFTLLARWPRWFFTAAAYGAWLAATGWFLVRPLARSFTLTGIARLIETHHPEMQERISSAVELLTSKDLPSIRGSDALIAALADEAVRDVGELKPRKEISFRTALPFAAAAVLLITVLGGLFAVRPAEMRFLVARAAAPFLNLPNVHASDLSVHPGDTLVAAGTRLQVSVRTSNPQVSAATFRQMDQAGREAAIEMAAVAATNGQGRRFAVTLSPVSRGFRYRILAGDALTRYYTVRVSTPPIIRHLQIHCRYPAYSRLAETQELDGPGTIRALAGTEVTVTAEANKTVPSALMQISTSSLTNTIKGVPRSKADKVFYDFSLTLPRKLAGVWTIRLSDEIGLVNTPFEHSIQTIADRPPAVKVLNPSQREIRLNRNDTLPVAYTAEDDLELASVDLRLSLPGTSNEVARPLPLPATPSPLVKAMRGETTLVMADPAFAAVPRFSFRLIAADSLPADMGGAQTGDSGAFTIVFDEQAASWKKQVLASQEKRIQQGLRQAQEKLVAAQKQAQELDSPERHRRAERESLTTRVDKLRDTLTVAENTLRDVAADIENGFFSALATNLNDLAENHVSKAEKMAAQIPLVDNAEERTGLTSNVTAEIGVSISSLDRTLRDFDAARAAVNRALELEGLAEKQSTLAQSLQAMEPVTNRQDSAWRDWQRAQEQVAGQLANLTRETPGAIQTAGLTASNRAAQAADRATELAARQDALAALTRQQVSLMKDQENDRRELAARQDQLATEARNTAPAIARSLPMKEAARNIAAGHIDEAIRIQTETLDALKKTAEQLARTPIPAEGDQAPGQSDPQQKAAENAGELARQAMADTAERGAPVERAARAAGQAAEAAQQARQSFLKASSAAAKARSDTDQTRLNFRQALAAATTPQQAKEAENGIARAGEQAAAAQSAADKAREEANAARQHALAAQQAADKTASAPSQKDAKDQAEAAESSSQAARQAAARAEDQARLAAEASTSSSPRERAAQAADRAAAKAAKAEEAAAGAQHSAKALAKDAEDSGKAAGHAAKGDRKDMGQAAGEKAKSARERADWAQGVANQASKAATEAKQAACDAAQAAKATKSSTDPDGTVRQAETAANLAREKAEVAMALADQLAARKSAKGSDIAADAQQAARRAQAASDIAQRLAQGAQQDSRKAGDAGRQAEQQAKGSSGAEKARQAAKQAGQAAERAQQAASQSAQAAQQAAQKAQQAGQAAAAGALENAKKAGNEARQAARDALDYAAAAADAAARAGANADAAQAQPDALKAADLAARQEELRRDAAQILAETSLAESARQPKAEAGESLEGIGARQAKLNQDISALNREAAKLRTHADQLLSGPAAASSEQAAQNLRQAAQGSDQAAEQMKQAASAQSQAPGKAASSSAGNRAGAPQEALRSAQSGQQAQEGTSQSLQKAAQALRTAASAMAPPVAGQAPTAAPVAPAAPEVREELDRAYQDTREAADSAEAPAAAKAAGQIARAADAAKAEARNLGGETHPASLKALSTGGGGGISEKAQVSEDVPALARRLGLSLADWLRLHDELKEDVLQSAATEGPEEYRTLIQRYFREVSARGGEEK